MGSPAVFFVDRPRLNDDKILVMSKGKSDKTSYKPYEQGQAYLIPPSAEELIPAHHLVRLVSETIDDMGIERLLRKYQVGGGASRYHPVMMTNIHEHRLPDLRLSMSAVRGFRFPFHRFEKGFGTSEDPSNAPSGWQRHLKNGNGRMGGLHAGAEGPPDDLPVIRVHGPVVRRYVTSDTRFCPASSARGRLSRVPASNGLLSSD
jgi:hypothetical protein